MRLEIFVLGLTAFFIFNAYNDGKYTKMLLTFKKYYKMIFYALLGIGIYTILKRNPAQGRNMLLYANNMVKYMPIDKSSMSIISPIFDFTGAKTGFMEEINSNINSTYNPIIPPNPIGINSSRKATKRSVSETKKKYVAYMQDWKCSKCGDKLTHTFEIDHKIRLEHGGGNDVTNLVALCRECHGQKTAMENM